MSENIQPNALIKAQNSNLDSNENEILAYIEKNRSILESLLVNEKITKIANDDKNHFLSILRKIIKCECESLKECIVQIKKETKARIIELITEIKVFKEEKSRLEKEKQDLENTIFDQKYDPITGLLMRREFNIDMEEIFNDYMLKNLDFTIAIIDLDDFKHVNDKFGHDEGDKVLGNAGQLLNKYLLSGIPEDSGNLKVYRLGGDEFAIIANYKVDVKYICIELQRVSVALKLKSIHGHKQTFSASVKQFKGDNKIVSNESDAIDMVDSISKFLKETDNGLYAVKKSGRDNIALID